MPPPAGRKAIREAAGETQSACAAALGVTRSAFANWESDTRRPDGEHLIAYRNLLLLMAEACEAEVSPAIRRLVEQTTAAQGVPLTVDDPVALERVAALVDQPRRGR